VCNFLPEHLEAVHDATGEYPEVNQIELHPYFPQTEALAYHAERGIVTEAWSPLLRGEDVFDEPAITSVAARLSVSAAEVILAWHAAIGSLPIPKSATPSRQQANLRAVDLQLTAEEIDAITALGRPDGRRKDQDPAVYEEF
jgi:diketogulonate reductase-like aldo/keto reductase